MSIKCKWWVGGNEFYTMSGSVERGWLVWEVKWAPTLPAKSSPSLHVICDS